MNDLGNCIVSANGGKALSFDDFLDGAILEGACILDAFSVYGSIEEPAFVICRLTGGLAPTCGFDRAFDGRCGVDRVDVQSLSRDLCVSLNTDFAVSTHSSVQYAWCHQKISKGSASYCTFVF